MRLHDVQFKGWVFFFICALFFGLGCLASFAFYKSLPAAKVAEFAGIDAIALEPSQDFTDGKRGLIIPNGYIDTSLEGNIVHGDFTFLVTTTDVKIRVQEYEDLLAQAWRIIASQNATIDRLLERPVPLNGTYPEVYQTGWEVNGVPADIKKLYHTENLTLREFQTMQDYKNYIMSTNITNHWENAVGGARYIDHSKDLGWDCDKYSFALAQQALADGVPVGMAIIVTMKNGKVVSAHATNCVYIGNNVYQADPQHGTLSNWNGQRIVRD